MVVVAGHCVSDCFVKILAPFVLRRIVKLICFNFLSFRICSWNVERGIIKYRPTIVDEFCCDELLSYSRI